MNPPADETAPSFLIVRRDNIGDLVCTTPTLRALRARYPQARICMFVNSYNADVLAHSPDVDEIYVYTKLKHRAPGQSAVGVLAQRVAQWAQLRRRRFGYVIIAGSAPGMVLRSARFARLLKPRHIIAFADAAGTAPPGVDMPVARVARSLHEVEDTFRLLGPLGIGGEPPRMYVRPDADEVARAEAMFPPAGGAARARIAVHISARKPSNRWSEDRFIALIREIHRREPAVFMLFWAPGAADDPKHPGDDAKARAIIEALKDVPIVACPTEQLGQLIGGLAICDRVICSDGGALHLAAALGKPILCFFGKSDARRWHPWGVPHVLLQPPSEDAADVSVAEAFAGFLRLTQASARPEGQAPPAFG